MRNFGVDRDFVLLIATENLSHKKFIIIENNEFLSVAQIKHVTVMYNVHLPSSSVRIATFMNRTILSGA